MGMLPKAIISLALLALVLVFLLFIDRGDHGARDARWWRGGEGDLMRRVLLREDGRFRAGAKLVISLILLTLIVFLWTLFP